MRFSETFAELLIQPLLITVVTVFAGFDARGSTAGARERWSRVIDRGWAILFIDLALSLVSIGGSQAVLQGDLLDVAQGLLVLFMAAMLIYAEPYACLEDDVRALTIVQFALLRSMMLAWVNMGRIAWFFVLQLAVIAAEYALERPAPVAAHAALFDIAISTAIDVPLAALFAVAYLDTRAQARKMA